VAACGSSGGGSSRSGGGNSAKSPLEVKVAWSSRPSRTTTGRPYATAAGQGQGAGRAVKIDAAASESNTDEQVSKLEAMTSANYDCYAVAPITATNLIQPLVQVGQNKQTIIDLDSPISTKDAGQAGVKPATFIASNHEQAGVLGAQQMSKELGGKASGAQVALVGGIAGDATSAARLKGFTDTAKQSGMQIVQTGNADWDRDKALTLAGDILRAKAQPRRLLRRERHDGARDRPGGPERGQARQGGSSACTAPSRPRRRSRRAS
jgi:ABC-type sugar transport system substrate-binding protein